MLAWAGGPGRLLLKEFTGTLASKGRAKKPHAAEADFDLRFKTERVTIEEPNKQVEATRQ